MGREGCIKTSREWSDVATSQGMRGPLEAGESRKDPCLQSSEGAQACRDFGILASKIVGQSSCLVSHAVCGNDYSSHSKVV